MQSGPRPSQQGKEAPLVRTGGTLLGSIQELPNLQAEDPEEGVSSRPESASVQFTLKAHCKWDGPFVITNVFPYGVVELKDENTNNTFQVNGHHLKEFHELSKPTVGEVESISLVESAMSVDTP
ncbi:hypothetical protein CR513_18941, partial [Mucuna pruriens]